MIVDFTIENFRSIKSEQLLSMYAKNKPKHHAGNIAYIEEDLGILRTCAIYGANAAGKTNVIRAFEALKTLITESGDWKNGDPIPCYESYLLAEATKQAPTRFEIEFYVDKIRYTYHIKYNKTEIVDEKLDFYPNTRLANIFTRKLLSDGRESIKFGEYYKGGKKKIAFFSNNSYLSKAGNTPDAPEMIRKVFDYFRHKTKTMSTNQYHGVLGWHEDDETVSIVNTFLRKVDLGIDRFGVENNENFKSSLPKDMPEAIKSKVMKDLGKREYFYHAGEDGTSIRFGKHQESSGTMQLFKLLPFFIHVLKTGSVLFVDEIEASFHPHIAELIIKLFNDPLVNKHNAQLIFTTHNLALMESDAMRKDQIYLTEKSVESGTQLYCLDDYDATLKDSSPFAKWYDEGRLGAIPEINYRDISGAIKAVF